MSLSENIAYHCMKHDKVKETGTADGDLPDLLPVVKGEVATGL